MEQGDEQTMNFRRNMSIYNRLTEELNDNIYGIPEDERPSCKLVGEDGNAFAIIGRVTQALRRAHIPKTKIDEYLERATSSDYNNLLVVTLEYVNDTGCDCGCNCNNC